MIATGLFERIFGARKEQRLQADAVFRMLNAYSPVWTSWGGRIYESELVRSAIDAKARHISKMSVRVQGSAKPTLQTQLRAGPNEFQTWSQFLYRLATILEVNSTAFIVPVLDRYGGVTGIFPVLPTQCDFVQSNGVPYLRYHFAASGQTAAIELDACGIMTKYQYANDLTGDGNAALGSTMRLIDIQNQGITEGVKSSATYRFMAQLSNFAKAEDLRKERQRFSEENLSAAAKGGGLLLFPNTYSNIQQVSAKPYVVDAEQMKLIRTNVYNYVGVNEAVMQNSADSTQLDAFYNGALEPFAVQLSEVLTKMMFTKRERASGSRVLVTSDRLQYMSVGNKMNLIKTMGDRGMITINEARELLNYAPVEDGDKLMPIRGEYYNAADEDVTKEDEDDDAE